MPLFQRAPATAAEMEKCRPIDLSPDEVAELDEAAWYQRVYRGDDTPQLTWRAVGMGSVLGFFLAFTNVYIGLKAGWHLGVALTASIVSYSTWNALLRAKVVGTPMTILENNCMQSTASAAGYATGGTMISAVPALLMLTVTPDNPGGVGIPWPVAALWVFFLAVLGTCLAIPMKRNLINQERLKFPSGTAAAVLLRSLYSEGQTAMIKARGLFYAALAAGVIPLVKDLDLFKAEEKGKIVRHALLPGFIKLFDVLPGIHAAGKLHPLSAFNIKLDYAPALLAAGALVGLRVTASMLVGGLVLALYLGPMGLGATWTDATGAVVTAVKAPGSTTSGIGIWVGAPMLVSSGLLSFAFQWRTIVRAFRGLRGSKVEGEPAQVAEVEVPGSWFAIGAGFAAAGIVAISARFFSVPVHFGVLAVVLTFFLALVACRSTGESDITPTGALGKIMQLTYGVLMKQNVSANLMTAGITAGASSASADLLTDLKSGYLLGANPRRQFIAQLAGIIPGTIAVIIGYAVLVPDATALTGTPGHDPAFPAPAAQQWMAVAKVFKVGLHNLHPMARVCIFYGLIAGVILTLIERAFPKHKKWLPSATGIGLGMVVPFYQVLSFFLGAVIGAIAGRKKGSPAAEMVVPVASGLIAGESIVGVIVAALNNFVLK
ncbi:Oligopeptide transporter, OPT family protein [Minicystis rosea]|nr:Oligopeptide transporter, OPT family protein [Minicystis rosea]